MSNTRQVVARGAAGVAMTCLLWTAGPVVAAADSSEFKPALKMSDYRPAKERNPFGGGDGAAPSVAGAPVFHLQGILYDAKNPTAIINDQLIGLRKPVTLSVAGGAVVVKAIEITREQVVLDVAGRRVELRLNTKGRPDAESK